MQGAGGEGVAGAGGDRRQAEAVEPHQQPGAGDDQLAHAPRCSRSSSARSKPAENLPGRPTITTARASASAWSSAPCEGGEQVGGDGVGLAVVEGDDGDAVVQPVGEGFGHGGGA